MGTFIDDAVKENDSYNLEYEDVIVQGQILDAKDVIKSAVRYGKNSVIWYYDYDSYDSYTVRRDNINPDVYADSFTSYKVTDHSSAGEPGRSGSVCDYLYNLVYHHKAGGPGRPVSFDYAYVERKIERELRKLGCKQVELFIGPKRLTVSKPTGNKSFWTGEYQYQDVTVRVIKWMISISW